MTTQKVKTLHGIAHNVPGLSEVGEFSNCPPGADVEFSTNF